MPKTYTPIFKPGYADKKDKRTRRTAAVKLAAALFCTGLLIIAAVYVAGLVFAVTGI